MGTNSVRFHFASVVTKRRSILIAAQKTNGIHGRRFAPGRSARSREHGFCGVHLQRSGDLCPNKGTEQAQDFRRKGMNGRTRTDTWLLLKAWCRREIARTCFAAKAEIEPGSLFHKQYKPSVILCVRLGWPLCATVKNMELTNNSTRGYNSARS